MSIILFSGVHGVGKGYFLNKMDHILKDYSVYTASQLIERYQLSSDAGYKRVNNVKNNQDVLICALEQIKEDDNKDIILDGHICLFNKEGKIERIPLEFFEKTNITGIVLLQDDVAQIISRLEERDKVSISRDSIDNMQKEELKYAKELQEKYNIHVVQVNHNNTAEEFENMLREVGGSGND